MGGPEAVVAIRLLFESSRGMPRLRVKQQCPPLGILKLARSGCSGRRSGRKSWKCC